MQGCSCTDIHAWISMHGIPGLPASMGPWDPWDPWDHGTIGPWDHGGPWGILGPSGDHGTIAEPWALRPHRIQGSRFPRCPRDPRDTDCHTNLEAGTGLRSQNRHWPSCTGLWYPHALRDPKVPMHAYPCIDIHARISVHGYPCLDIHAWPSMHGYPCMKIHAWISMHR